MALAGSLTGPVGIGLDSGSRNGSFATSIEENEFTPKNDKANNLVETL